MQLHQLVLEPIQHGRGLFVDVNKSHVTGRDRLMNIFDPNSGSFIASIAS
jgi:hypothetical protein